MALFSPYALGATLYMPATRDDIVDVVFGEKIPELRSLVVCLEDAVALTDVDTALINLRQVLTLIRDSGGRPANGPLLFVRPRDAAMARILNDWPLMAHVDGFVVPKLSLKSLTSWEQAVTNPALALMPTLKPRGVQSDSDGRVGEALKASLYERIIALRIGGNDLMGCLGLRRNPP